MVDDDVLQHLFTISIMVLKLGEWGKDPFESLIIVSII